ncbi:hypothetical protein [Tenacibaculum singaporense]|uniref:hypothetical protein n=1 Tax=Tenacibaculum singaporense TaxID=2358479 RepID=UPI000F67276E|nr:hypothetical protein [Tenacibaculum singaporense]RSC96027.1 hypothetical protein EI424_02600 [Tenacibaculum singaporense]
MNTILKHLSVTQNCTVCKKRIAKNGLIVTVPQNFSIADLTTQAKLQMPQASCKKHPKGTSVASFTFYHEVLF